uniref:Uncharacterized protein n=1 Tax=Sphaeramia orbicularis TaxID=375764 RepID=A0A672Z9E3_9TELE
MSSKINIYLQHRSRGQVPARSPTKYPWKPHEEKRRTTRHTVTKINGDILPACGQSSLQKKRAGR